jgi:hypothetical protein
LSWKVELKTNVDTKMHTLLRRPVDAGPTGSQQDDPFRDLLAGADVRDVFGRRRTVLLAVQFSEQFEVSC